MFCHMVLSGCDSIAIYFGCVLCYILKNKIKSSREMWLSWWAGAYAKADKVAKYDFACFLPNNI